MHWLWDDLQSELEDQANVTTTCDEVDGFLRKDKRYAVQLFIPSVPFVRLELEVAGPVQDALMLQDEFISNVNRIDESCMDSVKKGQVQVRVLYKVHGWKRSIPSLGFEECRCCGRASRGFEDDEASALIASSGSTSCFILIDACSCKCQDPNKKENDDRRLAW